jgi:hypothetical protein
VELKKEDKVLIYSTYHNRFWGPDESGYASNIENAGFYTREEAVKIVRGSPERNIIKEIDEEVVYMATARAGDLKARIERYEIILEKLKEFQGIIDKVKK